MNFLNVNFETKETILESFDSIAKKLEKELSLKINSAYYRIVDFEFYSYSSSFKDLYTHTHPLQLLAGKLYLHGSGIDITFGDGINYGGILLRGVIRLTDEFDIENGFMKEYFEGPLVVATELFSNLNTLNSKEKNEIVLTSVDRNNNPFSHSIIKTIKTKRVGLSAKSEDIDNYFKNLPIRYITIVPKFLKFKQTIKGIERLLGEQVINGTITLDDARKKILGYNKNFI